MKCTRNGVPLALVLVLLLGGCAGAGSTGPDPDATGSDDAAAGDAVGDDGDRVDATEVVTPPRTVFVQSGTPTDVRFDGAPWAADGGWLTADGCSRFLHGGGSIGSGDFRVHVRMRLQYPAGAVFLFRGSNHLLFDDGSGNMVLEGPLFPDDAVTLGPSPIQDDVPFTLELVREGDFLELLLDGASLHRWAFDAPEFGSVGLAPGLSVWFVGLCASQSVVSVSDFRVDGTTVPLAAAPDAIPVFTRGEGGYDTYRIPAVVRTLSGTTLAFAEGRKGGEGDSGDIDLVLRRSQDGGATWGPLQVVVDDGANTAGNPVPIVDGETGTVWLLFTTNDGGVSESQINAGTGSRDAWVTSSVDDGATWVAPTPISASVKGAGWRWFATGPGHGIQLADGRLLSPCNFTVGTLSGDGSSCAIVSDDHGATWQAGGIVPGGFGDESTVAQRSDGTLLLNFRSRYTINRRGLSTSSDRGTTWTPGQAAGSLIDPHCQGSSLAPVHPSWQAASGGADVLLLSNAASTQRQFLSVTASLDGGATWPVARWLVPGPAAYSDLVLMGDGSVGILYERGELSPYDTIVFSVLTPAWILGPAPIPTPRPLPGPPGWQSASDPIPTASPT
jgi:sialidase-1